MAGGSSGSGTKKNKILVPTKLSPSSCHSYLDTKSKTIKKNLHQRESQELKVLYLRHLNLLQQDINRIFKESLYCDLKIIHECKIIETNLCIIRIRSPWFYNVLRPYISYENKSAFCYIQQYGIYKQIKHFVRLLYTNLDISYYEQLLIQLVLNASDLFSDYICNEPQRKIACNKDLTYHMSCCSYENAATENLIENSPTSSDMADSGLETGSMISPQGTISENSGTDLDEPNESIASKKNHEISKACGLPCSIERNFHDQTVPSREASLMKDEISVYENRVLSDPFYESNDESDDDDEQANSYVPTAPSKFTEPSTIYLSNSNNIKINDRSLEEDKITQNGKKPNITIEQQHVDMNNSSASSNYYFIDASSLNDDIDVTTTNVVRYPNDLNGRLAWSNPQLPSCCYIPTSRSNNFFLNDDSFKHTNRKAMPAQNRFEDAAEFEQDFKFTESVEPFVESQKLKKLDSLLVQEELSSCKRTNKESLVVEIKEADSGESAQHSPCPDNTKLDNVQKDQDKLTNIASVQEDAKEEEEVEEEKKVECEHEEEINRKPSLIRRNTFELDANDEKLSSLRQEYERRQGSLVFQNSITQYSQHHLDGDSYLDATSQSDPTVINHVDLEANSQIPCATSSDISFHKYGLETTEKESKNIRLLSNTVNENTTHLITRSASDKLLADCDDDDDISFNSLPVNINDEFHQFHKKSKLRRNEAAPIISGGSSSSDFQKPTDSPIIKRKTESTPIVSGGSVILSEPQVNDKAKPSMSSSMTAWIVDMSDCRNSIVTSKKADDSQTSMSSSLSRWSNPEKEKEKEKDREKPQHSSLGYFVNLEDIVSPSEQPKQVSSKHRRRPSDTASEKNYCEFFVDLSDKSTSVAQTPVSSIVPMQTQESTSTTMASSQPSDSKKNIFSMFIDLNEPEISTSRSEVAKSSSSLKLADKRCEFLHRQDSEERPSGERKPKPGVFIFIESDSPLVRRRTLSSSRPAFKRHSWNSDKAGEPGLGANLGPVPGAEPGSGVGPNTVPAPANEQTAFHAKRVHKRAHSVSVDRVGDFRKLLGQKSSHSSHSLHEAASRIDRPEQEQRERQPEPEQEQTQTEDTFEYDVRDTPPNSHVEIVNEELLVSLKNRNYQELDAINEARTQSLQQEECCSESSEANRTRKSETFDISSSASGPSSDSDNLDFKVADLLDATQQKVAITPKTITSHHDNKSNLHVNEKMIKANTARTTAPNSFVRLSDLDKRPLSNSTNSSMIAATSRDSTYRLSSSVTETSWIESKLVMSSRTNEPLHRTLAKKLPLNLFIGSTKSENYDEFSIEGDAEAVISESDLSSLQSSMGRSGQEGSTEETETSTSFAIGKPYNRLGEDLLRMFLEEINPDVIIDVGGRRIKAHKCILSSRCQYFAAMLSGGWIESAGNVISLQGYSYNAVHFALCHIYSGESCIPDSISIVELATLADMLCLEGLKEVIGFTLKVKYCHLFHKPCNGCAVGVLECMPLAAAYGLDEVYRKSLRWVTRHFVRIWPSKEFATLPRELMDKCYHQHIVHMSADNVLQTVMDCDKLLTTLPNVRWAEPVFRLVSNLLDASMKYLTDNFATILGNETFQALDRELTWNISRLQDHLLAAAERLPPEQACKAYSKVNKMFSSAHTDDTQRPKLKWSPLFMDLMNEIKAQVEKCLIRDAARAARTNAWLKMGLDLRRHIQQLACLVIIPNETPSKRPSRHSNFLKEPKERQESKMPISRTPPNRNLDLRRVKMAMSEHNDRTLKQTPLLQTRKIMNKPKTDPLERKLQNEKLSIDTNSVSRPKSWPNKMEVKSRYLEPRSRLTTKESTLQTNQEKALGQQRRKIMISSSDSSRTSSPAMKRAAEKKALSKISKVPIKKDGKALSSDSLTESSSRLSVKKDVASRSCGITRPESPLLKAKEIEAGISIDSLADSKKKPLTRKTNRMDTSMSTDSLMTDITAIATPKSMATNKSSPILGKAAVNKTVNQTRNNEKLKKLSPPVQQRNTPSAMRRPARSLEGSTAASRSRAAAVVNTYHGSLSLRKSLLDAAKAPDIPSRALNSAAITRTSLRQSTQSMRSSFGGLNKVDKGDRKEESANNQRSGSNSGSKRSPKSNVNSRLSKSTIVASKQKANKLEDKSSNKVKSQTTTSADRDGPKFLNQSSRSGTFLKDEPTILKKSDIVTAAIDV